MLTTERLVLRDFESGDLDAVHAFKSDAEVLRYTDEEPATLDQAREWLEGVIRHNNLADRVAYNLAIVLRQTGDVIGWIGIGPPSGKRRPREYDFGYQLARRHWGRGYATEAVHALLGFAFGELRAHRVFAECEPANVASARVMEKNGMHREAHFRERDWDKGEWRDKLQYAVLDHDWDRLSDNPTSALHEEPVP